MSDNHQLLINFEQLQRFLTNINNNNNLTPTQWTLYCNILLIAFIDIIAIIIVAEAKASMHNQNFKSGER